MTTFTVPAPQMRGLPVDATPGEEEGDLCLRTYGTETCMGHLELRHADLGGCYCFKVAPCSYCLSEVPECTDCGWRAEEPF